MNNIPYVDNMSPYKLNYSNNQHMALRSIRTKESTTLYLIQNSLYESILEEKEYATNICLHL